MSKISAVIAAYNESRRIGEVVAGAKKLVDEVIVVDDGSSDGTSGIAAGKGAKVIRNRKRSGQLAATKRGFGVASGDVLVSLDGDGEHDPSDIPRVVGPILEGRADMVLGRREKIDRASERLIDRIVGLSAGKVYDSGTGFRAMRRDLAGRLKLNARCVCGILVMEALSLGARIVEVPIRVNRVDKPRKRAWGHFWQLLLVVRWLLKRKTGESAGGG